MSTPFPPRTMNVNGDVIYSTETEEYITYPPPPRDLFEKIKRLACLFDPPEPKRIEGYQRRWPYGQRVVIK